MFHPEVIAAAEASIRDRMGSGLPPTLLTRRTLDHRWAMRDQLLDAAPTKATNGEPARPLTDEEQAFITSEQLLGRLDYRYWSDAWAVITKETQEAAPIHPRWASQLLFLDHLAAMESEHVATGDPDGLLVNVGKARQLGLSTELEVIMAHRATTQTSLRGLVGADVETQATHLFTIFESVVANLPWWLVPPKGPYDTGRKWTSQTGVEITAAWGKSSRGGLADEQKQKGNIGRGRTYGAVHLSELSTWERPDQIDDGLLPAIPRRRRTFVGFESTAKGRYDWWHEHWLATAAGKTRFRNVFIPWYVEPDKYWAVPPPGWEPDAGAKAHAEAVERESPKWLFGRTVRLSREHLCWYQQTRDFYASKDYLYKFFEEYPATDTEMFQFSGKSVFSAATLEYLRRQERTPAAILLIEPAKEIAKLKEWERVHGAE